ncbi:MAG TPA: GDP-mannose 4,6-dehydratase, partial [Rhabdochlamydiaceae bacterium]|nr:GDP-mannose 4,6-dehydratase [Rhabdochlamydiaceae bacterium]
FAASTNQDPKTIRPLIQFIKDRPGHDLRYGINCQKIQSQLGWKPTYALEEGLKKTVHWYLKNIPR